MLRSDRNRRAVREVGEQMDAKWVEDPEGRFWWYGDVPVEVIPGQTEVEPGEVVDVATRVTVRLNLRCVVPPGMAIPDPQDVFAKVTRALTAGGSQSRSLAVPEPVSSR